LREGENKGQIEKGKKEKGAGFGEEDKRLERKGRTRTGRCKKKK